MENFPVKHLQSNLFRAFFIFFYYYYFIIFYLFIFYYYYYYYFWGGGGGAGAKFQLQSVTYTAKIQQNRV